MDTTNFNDSVKKQVARSTDVLVKKAHEYATSTDRLHNFVQAGHMSRVSPAEALGGMMVKHTVSIYDMIDRGEIGAFTQEQWREKITDHVNYLLILMAMVDDDFEKNAGFQQLANDLDQSIGEEAGWGTRADKETTKVMDRLQERVTSQD